MKENKSIKAILRTLTVILLIILTTSCDKEKKPDVESTPVAVKESTYFVKAKIDGEEFFSNLPSVIFDDVNYRFTIFANTMKPRMQINISIKDYKGSGTYTAGIDIKNKNIFTVIKSGNAVADKNVGTGTITIKQDEEIVEGTFSFTANYQDGTGNIGEKVTVTEGSFKWKK